MTIEEYQKVVDEWINSIGKGYYDVMTNTALLCEETGEVARLTARIDGQQKWKTGSKEKEWTKEEQNEAISDELCDVIWVATCIANQKGINLTDALKRNIEKKKKRDIIRFKD